MPIFIPIGGDGAAAVEFAGGLMQGVALHRERRRQEQMAIEAQRRAQEFQVEMEDKRLYNQRLREQDTRDWQQLMHRQGVADQRTLAQEADTRRDENELGKEKRVAAEKAARARMVAQAGGLEAGSPATLTPEQDPAGGGLPHGYLPGQPGPQWLDPADPEAVMRIKGQRERDAAAAANVAADNARAQAAADEAARHHKATEGAGGPKAAVDQADAEIAFLRQKLGQWQQDFKDAQAEIRDRGEATPELTDKLEKARAAWNQTNAEIKAKLAGRAAASRQYPPDVTTEAERREYDALLGR